MVISNSLMVRNKRLVAITIFALLAIEIASVAGAWKEVASQRPDFYALYSAARVVRSGGRPTYDSSVPGNPSASTSAPRPDTLHPPFESLIFLPLSGLSYLSAYKVWLGCNLVMLWCVPILLWRHLPRLHRDFHFISICYGSFAPVSLALIQGQDSLLLLLLLTTTFLALKREHDFRGGFLLGLCMFKFVIALPILLALALWKKWRFSGGVVCSCLLLWLVSLVFVGARGVGEYFLSIVHYGASVSSTTADHPALMPNLRGLLSTLLPVSAKRLWAPLISAILSIGLFFAAIIWRRRNPDLAFPLHFSMFIAVAVVGSYHFYFHNTAVLLLPLLLIANEMAEPQVGKRVSLAFAACACTMYIVPLLAPLEAGVFAVGVALIALLAVLFRFPKDTPAATRESSATAN